MKILYITHCCKKKNEINSKTIPEKLYSATYLQRFVKRCKEVDVEWGILSDKYGIVFPNQKIKCYELSPSYLLENQNKARKLIKRIIQQLDGFDVVVFYHNPGRFHPFYKYLVRELQKRSIKLKLISHLSQINIKG